jgi:hypothetical protein
VAAPGEEIKELMTYFVACHIRYCRALASEWSTAANRLTLWEPHRQCRDNSDLNDLPGLRPRRPSKLYRGGYRLNLRPLTAEPVMTPAFQTRLAVLILAFAGSCSTQEASPTVAEFWPELDVFWKLNHSTRLLFLSSWTRNRDTQSRSVELGANVDVYVPRFAPVLFRRTSLHDDSRMRRVVLRFGYHYIRSPDETTPVTEHRWQSQATLRWAFPADVLLSDRSRFEYRLVGEEFSWRYRNELKLERDITIRKLPLTPYISAELFYDSRFHTLSQWRYNAGVAISPGRRWAIEPYYTRQIAKHSQFRITNAAGLTIIFYGP